MASPPPFKRSKETGDEKDLISSLPTDVTHLILKKMPLPMAARTSSVSRTWKKNWLSLNNLIFDADFSRVFEKNGIVDGEKYCNIITNILLSHKGPVHQFVLHIPQDIRFSIGSLNLGPWLSFLSNNEVKSIEIDNRCSNSPVVITSSIFECTHLVNLMLKSVILSPPPCDFEGFPYLLDVSLNNISLTCGPCQELISKCPRLKRLFLMNRKNMNHIVINAPSLEKLVIVGAFESLSFKYFKMSSFGVWLKETGAGTLKAKLIDPMVTLANFSRLQYLHLMGDACKLLTAGGIRSIPLAFNHLLALSFMQLDLSDFDVYSGIVYVIFSCPNIRDLKFMLNSSENTVQHNYQCDHKKKLNRLQTIRVTGLRGTVAEVTLIKHLLAVSPVLKKLYYKCDRINADAELKMTRRLIMFQRAYPMTQLVYLEA